MLEQHQGVQFGIFLPIANGGWIVSRNAPAIDGSFELNRKAIVLAETIGLDFALSMMKWRGFDGPTSHWGTCLESMMLMSALSQVTSKIKVWCTVHTLLHNPAVVAKMVATLDHASKGRAGLNIVAGAYRDEFAQMGQWREDLDHDQRYELAGEWIEVVKRLWTEPRSNFQGRFFDLTDCCSDPKPVSRPWPTLVCAGISDVGLRLTAQHADAAFVFGQDDAEIGTTSRRAKAFAMQCGRTIKTITYCTVIPGETDREADARVTAYREGIASETVVGMSAAYSHTPRRDGQANTLVLRARQGFMTPMIAGSPETLRRKLVETVRSAELDGVMFIFPDFIEDQKFFGERVLPGLRDELGTSGDN